MRWMGRKVGVEVGQSASTDMFELMFFGKTSSLRNKGMSGLVVGDKQGVGNIYKNLVFPKLLKHPRNGKNISVYEWDGVDVADLPELTDSASKEFRYAAARHTEYVTRRTQPMFDMLHRSVNLSEPNFFIRAFFPFRTAVNAMEQPFFRAIATYSKSNKGLKATRKLTNDVSAVVASSVAVAIWKNAWKWMLDYGAVAGLAALGVYTYQEKKELKEQLKKIGWDSVKNTMGLNRYGQFLFNIGNRSQMV